MGVLQNEANFGFRTRARAFGVDGHQDLVSTGAVHALRPFLEDHQISRALPTETDVWHYADDAGLVVDALIQDAPGKPERVLEQGYSIRQAEPEEAAPPLGLEAPKRVA